MSKISKTITTCLLSMLMISIIVVPVRAAETNLSDGSDTDITIAYQDENTLELIIPGYMVEENPELFPDLYEQMAYHNNAVQSRGLILAFLGKVAVTVVSGVITHCIVTKWGESNACYRVLDWRTKPSIYIYNGIMYYDVYGKFTPGRIPGCEPMHSGPCNAGYWTVRYERN